MKRSLPRVTAICAAALAVCGAAVSAPPPDPGAALRVRIDAARSRLLAHYHDIDARSGLANVVETRLDGDEALLFSAGKPDVESTDDFWVWNATVVQLDESLVDQLASGSYHAVAAVRGIDDIPVPLAGGGTEPCALVVPAGYSPQKPAPLVVLLHARGESENDVVARPLIRGLAEETGAIIVAPFGRGDDLRSTAAAQDIYAALATIENALAVDQRRVYLAGDSLGGYAVFDLATMQPNKWAAFLAIRSTMDPTDQTPVKQRLTGKPVYIVAGATDNVVSVDDVRKSIVWFRSVGMPASYYETAGAGHDFLALAPSVRRAWHEMLAGVRSLQPLPEDIPTITPAPSQRP